jgi:peptidoglycan-associated lipoprotein
MIQAAPQVPDLPEDTESLNRAVQERGYLRDAFFETNSATLTLEAQEALKASAEWIKNNPDFALIIEGHTDERGSEQYNLALGDRRATIVQQYLTSLGVDPTLIRTITYGEERPFDPGHDVSTWAKNRRAHLMLIPSGVATMLGAIAGSVADIRGAAVAFAQIVIRNSSGKQFTLSTMMDGTYRRSGLVSGTYVVSAAKNGFISSTKEVPLAARGHANVTFVLVNNHE